MGADANTKSIFCSEMLSKTVEKSPTVDTDLLKTEDSTLPIEKAVELINRCNNAKSHHEEIETFKEVGSKTPILPSEIGTDPNYKFTIVWYNFIGFIILHLIGMSGGFAALFGYCSIYTTFYSLWLIYAAGQGVTMGAHRHWSHRAFKAKRWLKIILLYLHTMAGQNCLWVWVRDHRQHHKYSDTDADPHNANRGFWFSHVGWLCVRKHPKVIEYGKKIDMSDLDADPYIMFQKRHYKVLYTIFALGLPTIVPIFAWNENPWMALWVAYFARTIINLNVTWMVNSVAHLFGTRPYDETIFPVESMFVAALATGEGWHNYHHAFPWDYRAAELGTPFNLTCKFIDFFAKYGVIYDLREATATMVKNRCLRTGDRSHQQYGVPEAAPKTKTFLNIWRHPSNPTYTSVQKPKIKMLPKYGYALVEEELPKRELDDEILAKQNEILQQRLMAEEKDLNVNSNSTALKKRTTGNAGNKNEIDLNANYMDLNNNNKSSSLKLSSEIKQHFEKKSLDNLIADSVDVTSLCPGLATTAITYKLD
ncbi:CLUMA_CG018174, isoform A [Clunio marinus]|uniref:CLUMA_CG018174, isoform A n=1 Tax=Clunio marinus TaxID=568069 RepID=A0A1J1IZY5_9DIPT|nr:CLUMA_CG018174, isoform A [Clunio marinus]